MKIVSLTSENIKRLVAVAIKPNGSLVEITGKNGQGKTSVLDSIWWAITGTSNVQAQPIRKGQERASIRLDLGEIVITRTFTRKDETDYTTALSVRGADGSAFKSPQSVLDGLAGALSFDPLAFSRMKPKEQFESLREFVPGIDFEKVDGLNRGDYERRTEANRAAKTARSAAEMIHVPSDTPEEAIDEAALTEELQAAGTLNADVERRKALRVQAAADVVTLRDRAQAELARIEPRIQELQHRCDSEVERIEKQIAELQSNLLALKSNLERESANVRSSYTAAAAQFDRQADELRDRLDSAEQLPAIIDTAAIAERMTKARNVNANVGRLNQKALHLATAKKYEAEAEQLTESIDARNQAKREAIAKAQMPVPGLDFGDGVVLLNGVPFEQASDAERLRTSVAIAMAANPKLRVIRIRDGSLLDEDAMKVLEQLATARDFQVWIERVGNGTCGFNLVDGSLVDVQQEAAA